jgi:hypothetical protein
VFFHGILTEGEGSVQLTSLYYLVQISCFLNYYDFLYKRAYLNKEVNCTEPFRLVLVAWFVPKNPFLPSASGNFERSQPEWSTIQLLHAIMIGFTFQLKRPVAPGRLLALLADIRLG